MKLAHWIGYGTPTLLVGTIIVTISLEMARPGKVLCPLRRICDKWDFDLDEHLPPFIEELNHDELRMAKERTAAYRERALSRFPNLRAESRKIPLAENGYWHFMQLPTHPARPDQTLIDALADWKKLDVPTVREALAKSDAWVKQIEVIASMPGSSNVGLPIEHPTFPHSEFRNATRALLAKSLVEATDGKETEALQTMRSLSSLTRLLQNLEAPCIFDFLHAFACEGMKAEFILEKILPTLGPDTNLSLWQRELWQLDLRTEQIHDLARGEWIYSTSNDAAYEGIWRLHYQHELTDPDETAMVIADILSRVADARGSIANEQDIKTLTDTPSFHALTPEGRDVVEIVTGGFGYWFQKVKETHRQKALHQAAFDLLDREKSQGKLTKMCPTSVTKDPTTGQAFEFDPKTGRLSAQAAGDFSRRLEIDLPWRDAMDQALPEMPQE